ncbi:MAG: SAM-dependent methyltransferase [Candidatus Pelagibacter sp. TMED273]|nr:MAG: SAM-dependent methyltransferase [Candidatus Pelagibacter sp. TMED273]|tara:strand:+ start:2787 stop:3959 length:1173 start_codon:yes stop_codon:yes gene_type:complete
MIDKISDKIVFSALKKIKYGKILLETSDNRKYEFGEDGNIKVKIKINSSNFSRKIISKGSIGLAEAYMKNEFKTDNLPNLIELTAKNINTVHKFSGVLDLSFLNFIKNFFIKNTKNKSKENIAKHYDLGNDFFSLWLDKSLTYSSAIFENDKNNLEQAQINKYKKLSNLIKPKQGDKILEIGCGWGGFAEFMGKNFDINLDCITISKKQYEFAKERIYNLGLYEKINIKMQDYRDVKKNYDSIASIEMIEAVGQNYLKKYFQVIKNNLNKNGSAAIQAITIDDKLFDRYKKKEDFIQKYIFPGGFLPSKNKILNLTKETGLNLKEYNSYGLHYSNTLSLWRDEFMDKWDQISKQGFDNTFKRMWNFYLSYCEAGFKSKNIDLIQFSLQKR